MTKSTACKLATHALAGTCLLARESRGHALVPRTLLQRILPSSGLKLNLRTVTFPFFFLGSRPGRDWPFFSQLSEEGNSFYFGAVLIYDVRYGGVLAFLVFIGA